MNVNRCVQFIAALVSLMVSSAIAWAENVDPSKVWEMLSAGQCGQARALVKRADNVDAFLARPDGQSLYGKSVCCSSRQELSERDIDEATRHLVTARAGFRPLSSEMAEWLDDAEAQCELTRVALVTDGFDQVDQHNERERRIEVISSYFGKVMGECGGGNLSPALVPGASAREYTAWRYVVPNPAEPTGKLTPSADFIAAAQEAYVGEQSKTAVCAPFVALSAYQNPEAICKAAHRFADFFTGRYGARRPPTWTTIYHYPQLSGELYEHAKRSTGEINCGGVLGYYDWRRQSVVFGAPNGGFGTFQHELAHALMFWDIPLVPRWFDEGVASLYANTDRGYRPRANRWRVRMLEQMAVEPVDLDLFRKRVLELSPLEFEVGARPTTIGWAYFKRLNECGDLPGLYAALRELVRRPNGTTIGTRDPNGRPPSAQVARWVELIDRFTRSSGDLSRCP